jgi:hypothetical protein
MENSDHFAKMILFIQVNHSIFPVSHSYNKPPPRIDRNNSTVILFFSMVLSKGKGVKIEISMSKIKNRIATMKNCVENGMLLEGPLLKPHSKQLRLHFLWEIFLDTKNNKMSSTEDIITAIKIVNLVFIRFCVNWLEVKYTIVF